MTGWSIKGEAGATLDATERSMAAIIADGAILTFSSLDADTFDFTIATADAAGTGSIIPDAGQLIEVYHDGTRRFRGHVTIPRISTGQIVIHAEGPWWWLSRIMLSSSQADQTGTAAERASYVFPTQSVQTSLQELITLAALLSRTNPADAATAKFALGTVDAMFSFPRITLAEMSFAQALAELLSIVPDAVAWVSYAGTGLPTINVTRRGNMGVQTVAVGTDAVEEIDIGPRLDLVVSQVSVQSVFRRVTDGRAQWVVDSAGTPAPGKNQLMVVSGPEVTDFLPPDRFDSFVMNSYPCQASPDVNLAAWIRANDNTIATVRRMIAVDMAIVPNMIYYVSNYTTGNMNGAPGQQLFGPTITSKANPAGLYIITSAGRVPDWFATENGYTLIDGVLTGWAVLSYQSSTGVWGPADVYGAMAAGHFVGYKANVTSAPLNYEYVWFYQYSIPVQLTNALIYSPTTIYRQWDYDYLAPPAGLASALLGTQNWLPWEGRIVSVADDLDGSNCLNLKTNATGTLADCAAMGALSKQVSYDLTLSRKTVRLGASARVDFGTLASRFRRNPKDNIVYL